MAKVKQLKPGTRGWVTFPKRVKNVEGEYMVRIDDPQTHHTRELQFDYYVICLEDDLDEAKAHVDKWRAEHTKPTVTPEAAAEEEQWLDEWSSASADPNAF